MSINRCILCDVIIVDENDSKEHIIPNSIGGRKKLTGYICKKCNNDSGKDWDLDLAKQLNPLSLFFGINRERGEVPSQIFETTGGGRLQLNVDGKLGLAEPKYKETCLDTGVKIDITARSSKELRKMLQGVKRKYPHLDLETLLKTAVPTSSYPNDMVKFNLSFGGQKAWSSIVKTALALAVYSGVVAQSCENACRCLLGGDICYGFFYARDLIKNRPAKKVLHCVSVSGSPRTSQLLGYVEYFSVQRAIVCLSNEYRGDSFSKTYAIDPTSGRELELDVDLELTQEEIVDALNYKIVPGDAINAAFQEVIPIGLSRAYELEKNRVLDSAVEYAFKNCGAKEDECLTEEHINKLSGLIMQRLEPFLLHMLKKPKI